MSDILTQINKNRQAQVNQRLSGVTLPLPGSLRQPLDFAAALAKPGLQVIAEVKKASPSKGVIRPDFHPVEIAQGYAQGGAAAISVLTEETHFQGQNSYLQAIRQAVSLPLLRKDFIVDERQIAESYALGADAILLIVASLNQAQLAGFHRRAREFGLQVLVEVHDAGELERAVAAGAKIIGINNRNLKTFVTRLETSLELGPLVPPGVIKVAESGISNHQDCQQL